MSRAHQWFVLADGIAHEVITADITRYLGPDALVRPGKGTGEHTGQDGYWIIAYRNLTSQMIQDLKMDSLRWQQERGLEIRQPRDSLSSLSNSMSDQIRYDNIVTFPASYQDSRTHAARQHWGPTKPYTSTVSGESSHSHTTTTTDLLGPPPQDSYRASSSIPTHNPYSPYTPYSTYQPQSGYSSSGSYGSSTAYVNPGTYAITASSQAQSPGASTSAAPTPSYYTGSTTADPYNRTLSTAGLTLITKGIQELTQVNHNH